MKIQPSRHTFAACLCLALACLQFGAGCTSLSMPTTSDLMSDFSKVAESLDPYGPKTEYGEPVRMVALWSDAVLSQPGSKPVRGFGGRIYFYNAENKPVRVEGKLVVYAYDDSSEDERHLNAQRKFEFREEDLPKHYSESELGPSYSVWLPWDELGGEQMELSLLPVFITKSGRTVAGQHALSVLPGKSVATEMGAPLVRRRPGSKPQKPSPTARPYYQSEVQQVGYLDPRNAPQQTGVRSTTIEVPESLKRRMQNAAAQRLMKNSPAVAPNSPFPQHYRGAAMQYGDGIQQTTLATVNAPGTAPAGASPGSVRFVGGRQSVMGGGVPQGRPMVGRQPAHFSRSIHQAQALPAGPPVRGRVLTQPSPVTQPSGQSSIQQYPQNPVAHPASQAAAQNGSGW